MTPRILLATAVSAAAPAIVPPSYGVPTIIVLGVEVAVGTSAIAAGGALLCRLMIGRMEGSKKGDIYLTIFLMMLSAVMASEYRTGPGLSLMLGGILGVAGILVVNSMRSTFSTVWGLLSKRLLKAMEAFMTGDVKDEEKPADPKPKDKPPEAPVTE